jgi:CubicO group peptidase (beta-lactamase class C family)
MASVRSKDEIGQSIQRIEGGLASGITIQDHPPARWTLAERMDYYRVPGVSIAVINQSTVEWTKGYGVLEAGQPVPVTAETLFQAASISKPVAALAALHLVEQGLLDLDDDVNDRLISWRVPDNEFTRERIVTLRGILSHYAGLTVPGFKGYLTGAELPTLLEILNGEPPANSDPVRVDIEPGTLGRYSGGGTSVMQQLCVDVSGKPYIRILEDIVLEPLGMSRSTFEQPLPPGRFQQAAKGHNVVGDTIDGGAHVYPELAAAGLWATPSDLARLAIDIQDTYRGRGSKVISTAMVDQMLTYQWAESEPSPHPLVPPNMGLGLFLAQTDSALYFSHSGGNEGYRCQMIAMRDQGQGAVVMTNGNLGTFLFPEILFSIGHEYDWPDFGGITRAPVDVAPVALATYTGEYEMAEGARIRVTMGEERLVAQPEVFGWLEFELYPESETEFFITELPYPVSFVRDDTGKVVQMSFGEYTAQKVE